MPNLVRPPNPGRAFNRILTLNFPTTNLIAPGSFGTSYKDAADHTKPFDLPDAAQNASPYAELWCAGPMIAALDSFTGASTLDYVLKTIDDAGGVIQTLAFTDTSLKAEGSVGLMTFNNGFNFGKMNLFSVTGKRVCGIRLDLTQTGGPSSALSVTIQNPLIIVVSGF